MMGSKTLWALSLAACVCAVAAAVNVAADPDSSGADRPVVVQVQRDLQDSVALGGGSAKFTPLPANTPVRRFGGEARGLPGTAVYRNQIDPIAGYFAPGAGVFMADDLTLAVPGCNMVYYDLMVYGGGGGTFDVHVELIDGDPVDEGCTEPFPVIPGTEQDFTGILDDGAAYLVSVEFDPSIEIPETLFMSVTFSTDGAGWIIAEEAEIGTTGDSFAFHPPGGDCGHYYYTSGAWAGQWADIRCDVEDLGACCEGDICTESSDGACAGSWLGPGSECDPNPCGATTTCFLNDVDNGLYDPPNTGENQPWADDLTLCGPCEVAEYTLTVYSPVSSYTVSTVLLENIDPDTPDDPMDDLPGDPIAGTEWEFTRVGGGVQSLTAGLFYGIDVPGRIWLQFSVSPLDTGGPLLAGCEDDIEVGWSADGYAIWDGTEWTVWWVYPGDCPPDAAGSFNIEVVCWGDIRGACCSTGSIGCVDDLDYAGCQDMGGDRWTPNVACSELDPVCGSAACCQVDPQDPQSTICDDMLPLDCAALQPAPGDPATNGATCADLDDECGIAACINGDGDCLDPQGNGTPTCNDRDCCNTVCAFDQWCCEVEWDSSCAAEAAEVCEPGPAANDNCWEAVVIPEGVHEFSTLNTNTDGPSLPAECEQGAGNVLGHDVWYEYTPTNSGVATVTLCDLTDPFDTRIAAYEGCDCPVNSASIPDGGCDDDGCGVVGGESVMEFPVTGGTCYKIRIGGWASDSQGNGSFDLSWQEGSSWAPELSDPPDGAIDAGKPTSINNPGVTYGWDSIEISGAGDASGVTASDFTVTVDPADEPPPSIATVGHPATDTVTLEFGAAISTNHWTVITHDDSGWSTRIGYLPGDVNGDGTSGTVDILDLIDHLNGVIILPERGTDVDRSGATNSADILTAIDLLNGAGVWDPWLGETLP